jgi:hypothetical protein
MKQKLFSFFLAVALSVPVWAQQPANLVLRHADGTQTKVDLYAKPVVHITADSVIVTSSLAVLKFLSTDVIGYAFEKTATGISNPEDHFGLHSEGGNVYFHADGKKPNVGLYSLDGRKMPVRMKSVAAGYGLSLTDLPSGTYIVKVNGRTFKIVKP